MYRAMPQIDNKTPPSIQVNGNSFIFKFIQFNKL